MMLMGGEIYGDLVTHPFVLTTSTDALRILRLAYLLRSSLCVLEWKP